MFSFLSGGREVSVAQKELFESVFGFQYTPSAEGDHTADITWVGQHISKRLDLEFKLAETLFHLCSRVSLLFSCVTALLKSMLVLKQDHRRFECGDRD